MIRILTVFLASAVYIPAALAQTFVPADPTCYLSEEDGEALCGPLGMVWSNRDCKCMHVIIDTRAPERPVGFVEIELQDPWNPCPTPPPLPFGMLVVSIDGEHYAAVPEDQLELYQELVHAEMPRAELGAFFEVFETPTAALGR